MKESYVCLKSQIELLSFIEKIFGSNDLFHRLEKKSQKNAQKCIAMMRQSVILSYTLCCVLSLVKYRANLKQCTLCKSDFAFFAAMIFIGWHHSYSKMLLMGAICIAARC